LSRQPDFEVSNQTRIDKWLWTIRLFKTRTLAAAACRSGGVMVDGQRIKPARELRIGEIISASVGGVLRTVKVIAFPTSRVGAKAVAQFMEDLTPEAEFENAREAARAPRPLGPKCMGRPTKKNRRLWEKLGTENEP
jgi:ribosome-associated heat shock protein Hsp15